MYHAKRIARSTSSPRPCAVTAAATEVEPPYTDIRSFWLHAAAPTKRAGGKSDCRDVAEKRMSMRSVQCAPDDEIDLLRARLSTSSVPGNASSPKSSALVPSCS